MKRTTENFCGFFCIDFKNPFEYEQSGSVEKYTNTRQKSKQMQPPVIVMMMPPNQLQNQLQAFGGAMINPVQGNFHPMANYFNAFNNQSQPQQQQPPSVSRHQGGKMEVRKFIT